jgi:hypothetical protein
MTISNVIPLHSTEASRSEVLARIVRARLLLAQLGVSKDEAVSEALAALDERLADVAGMVLGEVRDIEIERKRKWLTEL